IENYSAAFHVASRPEAFLQSVREPRQLNTIADQPVRLDCRHGLARVSLQPDNEMGRLSVKVFQNISEIQLLILFGWLIQPVPWFLRLRQERVNAPFPTGSVHAGRSTENKVIDTTFE